MRINFSIIGVPVGQPDGTTRKSRAKNWSKLVKAALDDLAHRGRNAVFDEYKAKRVVKIHQVRSGLLTRADLMSSCVPCLEALQRNLLVYENSPRWMKITLTQAIGKPYRTDITVED